MLRTEMNYLKGVWIVLRFGMLLNMHDHKMIFLIYPDNSKKKGYLFVKNRINGLYLRCKRYH